MKIIFSAVAVIGLLSIFLFNRYEPQVKIYNRNGIISHEVRLWVDTVTVTSSNGFSVDISSAGFSGISTAFGWPIKNTNSVASVPMAQCKIISTTSITVNLVEQNSSTINLLGSNVLLGTPLQFVSNTTGLQVAIAVLGY